MQVADLPGDLRSSKDARMTAHSDQLPPADVCLLLRAHAEQHWLSREVGSVVGELHEHNSLPEEQFGAALAYLEVVWSECCRRAVETDAAHAQLDAAADGDGALHARARAYHAAVRTLRNALASDVAELLSSPGDAFTASAVDSEASAQDLARARTDYIRSRRWRPGSISSRIPPTRTAR
jgi:hypothetical protein